MAGSVEIIVNPTALAKSEQKLATLSRGVANRKLKVSFIKGKGATADSLVATAKQLEDIGTTLSLLISKTQGAVMQTRVSFAETDSLAAQWFASEEG